MIEGLNKALLLHNMIHYMPPQHSWPKVKRLMLVADVKKLMRKNVVVKS